MWNLIFNHFDVICIVNQFGQVFTYFNSKCLNQYLLFFVLTDT